MRDFSSKVNDTAPLASGVLDAGEFNVLAEELENTVAAANIGLDPPLGPDTSKQMLAQAMTRHASGALWVSDSGSANTHVVTMAGTFVPPTAMFAGLTIRFYPAAANTGAATCNAFGLGTRPIVNHLDAPLAAGSLDGRVIELIWDPEIGTGSWVLPAWANALYVVSGSTEVSEVTSGEGVEIDGENEANLNFSGLVNSGTLASTDIFARHVADTGHRGITWAQLSAALSGAGGGLIGTQFLTASGTYTKTAGTNRALVFAVGGGGGGGSVSSGGLAPGGGGGGTAIAFVDLSATETVSVLIGAGGAGGTGGGAGTSGGSTSFGDLAVASGGQGGRYSSEALPGLGGEASVGLLKISGQGGGAPSNQCGGTGGSSFLGGGGAGSNYHRSRPHGVAGGRYGGGGGGADHSGAGGAGAVGCVWVLEFA